MSLARLSLLSEVALWPPHDRFRRMSWNNIRISCCQNETRFAPNSTRLRTQRHSRPSTEPGAVRIRCRTTMRRRAKSDYRFLAFRDDEPSAYRALSQWPFIVSRGGLVRIGRWAVGFERYIKVTRQAMFVTEMCRCRRCEWPLAGRGRADAGPGDRWSASKAACWSGHDDYLCSN